jgi:hypothetical protein
MHFVLPTSYKNVPAFILASREHLTLVVKGNLKSILPAVIEAITINAAVPFYFHDRRRLILSQFSPDRQKQTNSRREFSTISVIILASSRQPPPTTLTHQLYPTQPPLRRTA